ncbi:hypothetical protein LJC07_08560 [Christensenellaceae bacterium OttesenSCG-928-L17]|nr:hypothetical protein [Christensenellaceae bacterium OttesenSCG-928-L17]
MVSNIAVALNISLLTYACMARIDATSSMLDMFLDTVLWLILVAGCTIVVLQFFRRRSLTQYDKPTVFIAGAVMLGFAITGTYRDWFAGWGVLPGYLLWGAGLACLLSIIVTMGADMREVLELDMSPEELEGYQHNTAAIIEWNLTYAVFLVLLFLTLISFIAEGKANEFGDMPFVNFLMRSMTAWPAICIFVALIYALMQPLNKDYAKKLAHYRNQQRLGTVNPALKTQLQLKLVQGTRRILPSVLRAIVRPLMPCKVIGKEHVDVENGPVVFVCNHLEIYGPIITNLHLPFYFRSWIISRMLDREVIAEHLTSGINIVFHWVPEKIRAKLPGFVAPIVLYILQSLDPIPVYRGTMREVIKTIQLSVDAMEYEDNILLFPENPGEGQYKLEGVSQFYSGFVTIGAEYYKRTGNATTFYPMYVNRAKRTLTIGEGIRYDTENSKAKEKDRIVEALHNWMEAQAPAEE